MTIELSPIVTEVEAINKDKDMDPDAIDDLNIKFSSCMQEILIGLTETQANDLAIQIGQVLQDIANKRTEDALVIAYETKEKRRIATWQRIKARKQETRA